MEKKGNLVAVRPEKIIEARFSLTSVQNDILDILFSQINDDDITEYELDIDKYAKIYNANARNIYRDFKKAVESFEGKGFSLENKINEKKIDKIYYAWFTKIHYKNGEGKIVVSIHLDLKKIFVEMKKRIYYNIKYTLNFNCIYSKRIYYYLKSFVDTGWRIDNLDILRTKLECPESYKDFYNFKRFVLNPAQKEINSNSDIRFDFEEIKEGRKVVRLKFIIEKVNMADEIAIELEESKDMEFINEVKNIIKEDINESDAKKILEKARGNLDIIREKYEIVSNLSNVNNLIGAMIKAIEQNWEMTSKNKVSTFCDYDQRSYDFDELEKQLTGWK